MTSCALTLIPSLAGGLNTSGGGGGGAGRKFKITTAVNDKLVVIRNCFQRFASSYHHIFPRDLQTVGRPDG